MRRIVADAKTEDTRNVIDYYKGWELDEIKADLDTRRTPLVNICMNLGSDFNKSSVVRANNAFLGRKVFIVGKKKIDPRGSVGTRHYEHVEHSPELAPVIEGLIAEGYSVCPVDNIESYNPKNLFDVELPEKVAFVYGEEGLGLSSEAIELCNGPMIAVQMYGSVRSLNVAQCAAVLMAEYSRQHGQRSLSSS